MWLDMAEDTVFIDVGNSKSKGIILRHCKYLEDTLHI